MAIRVSLSLTPGAYSKLLAWSEVLGLSRSAIVSLILVDPIYGYLLDLVYRFILSLRSSALRNAEDKVGGGGFG